MQPGPCSQSQQLGQGRGGRAAGRLLDNQPGTVEMLPTMTRYMLFASSSLKLPF